MDKDSLYLIDATAFCYRAFYAIKGLSTSFGQPTGAVYGVVNMLNKILKDKKPEYIAACFDVSRETFRTKKFAEYKMQRPPMPDDLSSQISLIKDAIRAYGINIVEKKGYEADDIIATVAQKVKPYNIAVVIISSDKDILQLVDQTTLVFNPYRDNGVIYTSEKVEEFFGVGPKQIPDVIALMGDTADNIPGVSGIGEKTAKELVRTLGSVESVLQNIAAVKQDNIRGTLSENIENIKRNKELVLLDKNVDMQFDLKNFKAKEPDYKELSRLFNRLEFRKLLKELPVTEMQEEIEVLELKDKEAEVFSSEIKEIYLSGDSREDIIFCTQGKFFRLDKLGQNIKSILEAPNILKISHDLKKIKVLLAGEIVLRGPYFDTMIAAYLINPSKGGYELSSLAMEYLDKTTISSTQDAKNALYLILQLKPKLENLLKEKNLLNLFKEVEMPLVEVLAEMELNGIKIDIRLLKELSVSLEKRLIELISEIYSLSSSQFNINSPKQLRQILFEKLKLPVIKRSKTGPSTDEEVLRKLAESYKLPQILLEYRQLTKLKTAYVDSMLRLAVPGTDKIHTLFNQTATETGRLSSSSPNLQNLPVKTDIGSKIRQAVVSYSKNSCLLSCDYSQIELRILAHISQDENLVRSFKENKDIHRITAALIFKKEEKDITLDMRELAKRVNFGIIYGLRAFGLSKDLNIPVEEAQTFIDSYFLQYPKVKEYIESQIKKTEKDGFVTTILGRRRYIPEINNKNLNIRQFAQRQAVNTPIQGSASDIIKLAMVKIHNQIEYKGLASCMLIQIHDELVFDVPDKEFDEVFYLAKNTMENVLPLDVPVVVNAKKGRNWLDMETVK